MVGKCGILPFELARLFAGGISDYRLHRLIEDETLARKGDGLDADQFFVALAQQEEVRSRVTVRRQDNSAKLLMAFTPGFLEVWEPGLSTERLPGLDYDVAIRDAIIEGSGDPDAAAAIENRDLAAVRRSSRRPAGGLETAGQSYHRRLAEDFALAGSPRLAGQFGAQPGRRRFLSKPARRARDGSVDEALDNSARSRPAHRPRQK